MLYGAKIPGPTITHPLEFTWITTKMFNKQHVRKILCPTEMLWVEQTMFFPPNLILNRVKMGNVKYELFSVADKLRPTITKFLENSWITLEVSRNVFCSTKKLPVKVTHPIF